MAGVAAAWRPWRLVAGMALLLLAPTLAVALPPALLLRSLQAWAYVLRHIAPSSARSISTLNDACSRAAWVVEWDAYPSAARYELTQTARRLRERLTLILTHHHAHMRWQNSRAQPAPQSPNLHVLHPGTCSEHEVARTEFLFCFAEFLATAEQLRREAHRGPGGCLPMITKYLDEVVASLGCDDPRVEAHLAERVAAAELQPDPMWGPSTSGERPQPSLDASTSALQLRMIAELMLQEESKTRSHCIQYARFCRLLALRPSDAAEGSSTAQQMHQVASTGEGTALTIVASQLQGALAPLSAGYDDLAVWSAPARMKPSNEKCGRKSLGMQSSTDGSISSSVLKGTLLGARMDLCIHRLQVLEQACAQNTMFPWQQQPDVASAASVGLLFKMAKSIIGLGLSLLLRIASISGGSHLSERLRRSAVLLRTWCTSDDGTPTTSAATPAPHPARAAATAPPPSAAAESPSVGPGPLASRSCTHVTQSAEAHVQSQASIEGSLPQQFNLAGDDESVSTGEAEVNPPESPQPNSQQSHNDQEQEQEEQDFPAI